MLDDKLLFLLHFCSVLDIDHNSFLVAFNAVH